MEREFFPLVDYIDRSGLLPDWRHIIKRHGIDDCSKEVNEKMVQVEKAQLGGEPYLNKKMVSEKKVTKVKILDEAQLVDTEFKEPDGTIKRSRRIECTCSTQVADPKQVRWQMNPTTQNYMIDKYGSDTRKWIGLEIEVAVKQAGSAQPGVYPRDCSLEKVLA